MIQEHYVQIGKTKKVHGIDGDLRIQIDDEHLEDIMSVDFIFLEIDGGKVPFFVENIQLGGAPMILLEDLKTNEDALPYTAKKIFLREKDIIPAEQRQFIVEKEGLKYKRYVGYSITDISEGEIGEIKEILDYPQQEMAQVSYQGKEILLPMNDALIEGIDTKSRTIIMDLPEGLLDL